MVCGCGYVCECGCGVCGGGVLTVYTASTVYPLSTWLSADQSVEAVCPQLACYLLSSAVLVQWLG